ncbi:aminotransferase-like domain-containing protein [Dongia rigui]|uniref:PLP-dependent aminotransferase family protein n=1 Tax=Dongia rigui TaxID=940149 RepID=A0ABU5DZM2_9PROT|nr:PLP-dependent aminotransferase family protein [Dongia rigui]MDY0872756.1 PLP-dependent aminotransferase family protein [Dongia rigui]
MRQKTCPWLPDMRDDDGPLYLAIADRLAADLQAGRVSPGQQLPTQRALAEALGIDFTTVSRGYAEARRRGLIDATVGRGTFVRAPLRRDAAQSPIDMSMNLPPLSAATDIAGLVRDGMEAITGRADFGTLMTYRDSAGTAADRAAGGRWLQDRVGAVPLERLLIAGGTQLALTAILTTYAKSGDRILTEALTYPGFRAAAEHLGLRMEGIAMDDEGLLPDALDAACQSGRVKLLYCAPTLHNPTTATMSETRRQQIADVARRNGLTIIEDDSYGLLARNAPPALARLAPDITIYLGGLSKVLTPALRVTYMVVPDAWMAERLAGALRAVSQMTPPLMLALASHWILEGIATRLLSSLRDESVARQRLATGRLPRTSLKTAPEAYHLWLHLPEAWPRAAFVRHLQRQNIAVVASDAFAVTEQPPEAVRLCLGAATDRESLDLALTTVATTLTEPAGRPVPAVV